MELFLFWVFKIGYGLKRSLFFNLIVVDVS